MKLLFNCPHNRLTGVNTHTFTLAKELRRNGYHTDFFFDCIETPSELVQQKFSALGNCYINVNPPNHYDIIYLVYSITAEKLCDYKGKKYFIVHGIMHPSYFPHENHVDKIFCVSNFGVDFFKKHYSKPILLSNNYIDTNRFVPTAPINKNLKNVLLLDSRNGFVYQDVVIQACHSLGLRLKVISCMDPSKLIWDIEEQINEADLVIGYGRSIYEAMSCGRCVICYGINYGDGYLDQTNFQRSLLRNCSGWEIKNMPNYKDREIATTSLINELKKYNHTDGNINRQIIIDQFEISSFYKLFLN